MYSSRILVFAMLLVFSLPTLADQSERDPCIDAAASNQELSVIYETIRKEYAGDGNFLEKLSASQRAWEVFREAHLESIYPAFDKQKWYGSVYPMCRCDIWNELTSHRIRELRQWLDGVPRSSVCAGSIRYQRDLP